MTRDREPHQANRARQRRRPLRWWLGFAVIALAALAVLVPAAGIASFMVGQAIGSTTVVAGDDGSTRTIRWRDYPSTADLDPREILRGPTPAQGHAQGQAMVAEIKAALGLELGLEWVPSPEVADGEIFHAPVYNDFGGESLLTAVNSPAEESTTVPRSWAGKQRSMEIIGEVAHTYGFGEPVLESLEGWGEDEIRGTLGGIEPQDRVHLHGTVQGPAGQWLSFRFTDLSKDIDGSFTRRSAQDPGTAGPREGVHLMYGANGLLPAENRDEFNKRLEPYLGLVPPPARES